MVMMQVIAIEDENWWSSIKYHYSDKKIFATYNPDYFEEEDTSEEEVDGYVGVEKEDSETEVRTSLIMDTQKKPKEKKNQEENFLEKNFFLVIVGGSLAGIFLLILVFSILLYLMGKLCKKPRVEEKEPEDRNLSIREQRVLSLILKSSK